MPASAAAGAGGPVAGRGTATAPNDALPLQKDAVSAAPQSGTYTLFTWNEDPHLLIAEWWNAPSTAACDYAANPWPQAQLAAQRIYVLGARQVLRDEWDIGAWIAQNRAATSEARIHGTETGCYGGHLDYPPHLHVFYLVQGANGPLQINSHHYTDANGQISGNFIIPSLCGQNTSYQQPVNAWLDMLDETCSVAWQQRYTSNGDLELRLDPTAPVYQLRIRSVNGDLAGLDVRLSGSLIYSVDVTQYDPVAMTMVATIKDYRNNLLTTETWKGNAATGSTLDSHTTKVSSLGGAPTSTPTPAATSTPTSTRTMPPTATRTPAPTSTPTPLPTSTPTPLPTSTPTMPPTATPTPAPTASQTPVPTPTLPPSGGGGGFRIYLPLVVAGS